MKSIFIFSFLIGSQVMGIAQVTLDTLGGERPYNRWSIELGVGQNKPIRPFSPGYYSSNPNRYFNISDVLHYEVGVRYMFNPKFGLKLDGAYDRIYDQSGSDSNPFDSRQYRLGLQGIVNVGRVLNFESFTNRFGLLAHGGIQVSRFTPQIGPNKEVTEDNGGIMLGLTPQFRITNWLVVWGDFTVLNNVRQHFNWDGTYAAVDTNLTGILYNTSFGLSFNLGKKEVHADWFSLKDVMKDIFSTDKEARERLEKVEAMLNDVDRDGVPDYLDRENNTPAGVAVDSRGRFIDVNKNGVPDEMERTVEEVVKKSKVNQIDVKNDVNSLKNKELLNSLVENGYVSIYYDVNEDIPNSGSTSNLYLILTYLKNNPKAKIILHGFADHTGVEKQNKALSERRASKLKKLFIVAGISSERIGIQGNGVDKSNPSNNGIGLNLSRKVAIEVIE
jgi:OOP family OmpA-OmpF porin